MKTWQWAFAAVMVSGCLSPHLCSGDEECSGGGVCDATQGFCVFDPDGGTCEVACADFETCQPTSSGGLCRAVTLSIRRPTADTVHEANAEIVLEVEALSYAGTELSTPNLPAFASGGATGPRTLERAGGVYLGTFVLGANRGEQELGVGWAELDASVRVLTTGCDQVSCAVWEQCQPTTSGGRCVDQGLLLSWDNPAEGGRIGPASTGAVGLGLRVSRADGGPSSFDGALPYTLVGRGAGNLRLDPLTGSWRDTIDAGADDGPRTLIAGWDGGPTATTTFAVVATPVAVALHPEAPPNRAAEDTDPDGLPRWKKHELVPVLVESSRPLANLSASSFSPATGVRPSTACRRACPDAGFCSCFEVDLAQQPLVMSVGAISGSVTLGLRPVEDVYGNGSLPMTSASIDVTRFKWVRTITSSACANPTAVAVTPTGMVVVGANTGASAPLVAFRADGQRAWQDTTSYFSILSGPLIGAQGVYFGAGIPSGRDGVVRRVDLDGQRPHDVCSDDSDSTVISLSSPGLALASPGPDEHLWTVRSSSEGTSALRADLNRGSCLSSPVLTLQGRTELVVAGQEVLIGATGSSPVTLLSTTVDGGGLSIRGSASSFPVSPENLFAVRPGLWGGAGGPASGGAFLLRALTDGGALPPATTVTWGRNGGGAGVVGGTGLSPIIYSGSIEGDVVARTVDVESIAFPADGGLLRTVSPLEYQSDRAPLLGRGGRLYVLGRNGVLRALDTATLVQEWFWTVPSSLAGPTFGSGAVSELNLDIARDVADPCAPGQPGVLYFAAAGPTGTRLWAILVDSAGVDRQAPWPRSQHDPANTGNLDADLSAYTCP